MSVKPGLYPAPLSSLFFPVIHFFPTEEPRRLS